MDEIKNSNFNSKSSLKFIDGLDDSQDHYMFLWFFLAGTIPLAILRLFFGVPAIFVTGWLIFLLFVYAAIIWKTRRFRLREDRAADNLYFLGFLFTVAALMVSLVNFSAVSNEAPLSNNPLSVVGDLGTGLATTLLGLFLKVFFTQLRTDPEEIEHRIRVSLSDAAERTRDQIIETVSLLEESQDLTKQILKESRDRLVAFNRTFESSIEQLSEKVKNLDLPPDLITARLNLTLRNAQKSLETFSDKTAAVKIPSDILTSQIKSSLDSLTESLSKTLQSEIAAVGMATREKLADEAKLIGREATVLIGNIEVPPDIVQKKLEPVIENLVSQFTTATDQLISGTQSFVDRMSESSEIFADSDEQLATSTAQYRESFALSLETISLDLKSVSESFKDNISEAIQTVGLASDVYQENATSLFGNFDARLQAPVSAISESISKVEESFDNLISAVDSAKVKIDNFSDSLRQESSATADGSQEIEVNNDRTS